MFIFKWLVVYELLKCARLLPFFFTRSSSVNPQDAFDERVTQDERSALIYQTNDVWAAQVGGERKITLLKAVISNLENVKNLSHPLLSLLSRAATTWWCRVSRVFFSGVFLLPLRHRRTSLISRARARLILNQWRRNTYSGSVLVYLSHMNVFFSAEKGKKKRKSKNKKECEKSHHHDHHHLEP